MILHMYTCCVLARIEKFVNFRVIIFDLKAIFWEYAVEIIFIENKCQNSVIVFQKALSYCTTDVWLNPCIDE